jgi:DNA-binding NtrC family response regulator
MGKKILIVDDDPTFVDYLTDLFEDNGYETCSASDAAGGFDVLKEEKPDLITLDLDMPEVAGPLFYIKFSKMDQFKDIPVIVISGMHAPNRAIKKAFAALNKPVDRTELLQLIKNAIG